MKTRVLILCLLLVSIVSCGEDEELQLQRVAYTGNEIRTDGCYYQVTRTDSTLAVYLFFYRNGVLISFADNANLNSLDEFENLQSVKNWKTNWRVFNIKDSIITTQGWGDPWGHRRPLVTGYAKIINDTTILWYKQENTRTGTYEYNSVVNFRKFSPKPDSTNVFIK